MKEGQNRFEKKEGKTEPMKKRIMMVLAAMLILMSSGMAEKVQIVIPDIITEQTDIPDNEALRFVRDMKAGWNLGNTFDAFNCSWVQDPLDYESAWCGVKTSERLIEMLQESGFHTIRIPVSWHNHLDTDWTINSDWLDRVKEVVSWAYDRGMYVILNIHHDCDPAFYYPSPAHAETSERYIRTIWSQLAESFGNFGDRLIFESINEPRLVGTGYEWNWNASIPECRNAMKQIVRLNQIFVDVVRAAGGENTNRYLMVPAYDANPEYACNTAFTLPTDSADNRIIVSAHAYSPYSFALEQPGTSAFSLNDTNQKSGITGFLSKLYRTYISKGIPVVIGEFGAMEKNGNLQDRVDWVSFYVAEARSRGITCCWWDNNIFEGTGERFGLFDREAAKCVNPEILEAIMRYCQ